MSDRPSTPIAVKREVLFEARHRCAVCCDPLPLELAHIIPWCETQEHTIENLIALCANCHERADKEKWGAVFLRRYKQRPCALERNAKPPMTAEQQVLIDLILAIRPDRMTKRERLRLASMIAAYAGVEFLQVRVLRVEAANSARIRVELPLSAAKALVKGQQSGDSHMKAFFEDWQILRVEEAIACSLAPSTLSGAAFAGGMKGNASRREVFLSYAREDSACVDAVAQELRARGFRLFLDRLSIAAGDSVVARIDKAITTEIRSFIVFLSRASLRSAYVRHEVDMAIHREIRHARSFRVLPVLLPKQTAENTGRFSHKMCLQMASSSRAAVRKLADEIERTLRPQAAGIPAAVRPLPAVPPPGRVLRPPSARLFAERENRRRRLDALLLDLSAGRVSPARIAALVSKKLNAPCVLILRHERRQVWREVSVFGRVPAAKESLSDFVQRCGPLKDMKEGNPTPRQGVAPVGVVPFGQYSSSLWCPIQRQGKLVGVVVLIRYSEKTDRLFETFDRDSLVKVARELVPFCDPAETASPTSPKTKPEPSPDVGIIVALTEEFRLLHRQLSSPVPRKDAATGRHDYFFKHDSASGGQYHCVATLIGEMGLESAAVAAEQFLQVHSPKTVVMLGIAGGIDEDVRIGDVIVGTSVLNYLTGAKVVPGTGKGFDIQAAGEPYRCSKDLIHCARNLEFAHPEIFEEWKQKAEAEVRRRISTGKRKKLLAEACIESAPAILDGPIASGPVVGAAKSFKDLLKRLNRRLLALEMEGGGMLAAACSHANPSATLLLRGVSDFGDERKNALDRIGNGGLRAYAMNNAIRLLWLLLDTGALPREGRPR